MTYSLNAYNPCSFFPSFGVHRSDWVTRVMIDQNWISLSLPPCKIPGTFCLWDCLVNQLKGWNLCHFWMTHDSKVSIPNSKSYMDHLRFHTAVASNQIPSRKLTAGTHSHGGLVQILILFGVMFRFLPLLVFQKCTVLEYIHLSRDLPIPNQLVFFRCILYSPILGKDSNLTNFHMGVSKNNGTPKSSILIGFSIINHPFWGIFILGNSHIS